MNKFKVISSDTLHIEDLKKRFRGWSTFNISEIANFYRKYDPLVSESTVSWRIYSLTQGGIISRVGRGKFILGKGREFQPVLSKDLVKLYDFITIQLPYVNLVVWSTSLLNEFMTHQPGKFYNLVEVEKDAIESVFYLLQDSGRKVFLDPTEDLFDRYVSISKDAVIVKPLVSEAPLQVIDEVKTITIEKLLVDIFSDHVLFGAFQGKEMGTIFENAYRRYLVNENKLLRYADRRRKKDDVQDYLKSHSKYWQLEQ